jgi:hypothetical protein
MAHLLLQTQSPTPGVQDELWSALLPLQYLAPAWVCPIGSLCDAGEHTRMGRLIHLNGPESCNLASSTDNTPHSGYYFHKSMAVSFKNPSLPITYDYLLMSFNLCSWNKIIKNIKIKMSAFWDIVPCSLVEVDWRFRGAYCVHNQDN